MMLKIKQLIKRDQGRYGCTIRFGNVSVTSEASLMVTYSKVPIVVPHQENVAPTLDVYAPKKNEQGQCVAYKEGVCENYLNQGKKQLFVFESKDQPIELLNQRLQSHMAKLRKSSSISKK